MRYPELVGLPFDCWIGAFRRLQGLFSAQGPRLFVEGRVLVGLD